MYTAGDLDRLSKFSKKRKNLNGLAGGGPANNMKVGNWEAYKPSLRLS